MLAKTGGLIAMPAKIPTSKGKNNFPQQTAPVRARGEAKGANPPKTPLPAAKPIKNREIYQAGSVFNACKLTVI